MTDQGISKSELARRLGVKPPRVSQYVDRGMPTLPSGLVDEAEARAWLEANLDHGNRERQRLARAGSPPRGGEQGAERRRREAAQAELAEIRVARERGELAKVAAVEEASRELIEVMRQAHAAVAEDVTVAARSAATKADASKAVLERLSRLQGEIARRCGERYREIVADA